MVSDSCHHLQQPLKGPGVTLDVHIKDTNHANVREVHINDAMLAIQVQDSVQTLKSDALITQFFTAQHVGNIRSAVF